MRNLKKVVALVLALSLVLSMATTAFAATTASEQADVLYDLGLFLGYSETEKELGLEDASNAAQALTLIGRALGWEVDMDATTDFEDLQDPKFSALVPYVVYAVESNITVGISDTEFGVDIISGKRLVVWVLRALGNGVEESWDNAEALAEEFGLTILDVEGEDVLRSVVASVIFDMLDATPVDGEMTVIETLVADNEELKAIAIAAGLVEAEPVVVEFAVASVTATNLKTVAVNLTAAPDKDTLTTANFEVYVNNDKKAVTTNYTFDVVDNAVVISFNSALAQSDSVKVVLKDKVLDVDGRALVAYESTTVVTDVAVPVVTKVEFLNQKEMVIYTSEPITATSASLFKLTDLANSAISIKIDGSVAFAKITPNYFENKLEVEFFNALTAGSKTVEIAEAKDFANFKAATAAFVAEVVEDKTAPVLESVKIVDRVTLELSFTENLKAAGTIEVFEAGSSTNRVNTASIHSTKRNVVVVDLTGNALSIASTLGVTVKYINTEDLLGNKVTTKAEFATVNTDDTVIPTATVKVNANNTLEVAFDKSVTVSAANFNLLDKDAKVVKTAADNVTPTANKTNTYTVTFSALATIDTANYSLEIVDVVDNSIRQNKMPKTTLAIVANDTLRPTLVAAYVIQVDAGDNTKDRIQVNFSEAMNATDLSALNNIFVGSGSAGTPISTITNASLVSVSANGKQAIYAVPNARSYNRIAVPATRDVVGNLINNATIASPVTIDATFPTFTQADITVEVTGKNTIVVKADNNNLFVAAPASAFKFVQSAQVPGATTSVELGVVAAQIAADQKSVTLTTSVALNANATYTGKAINGTTDINGAVTLYIDGTTVKNQNDVALAIASGVAETLVDKIKANQTTTVVGTGATADTITISFDEAIQAAAGITNTILAAGIEVKEGTTVYTPVLDYTAEISGGAVVVKIIKDGVINKDFTVEIKRADYLVDASGNGVVVKVAQDAKAVTEKTAPEIAVIGQLTVAATQVSGAAGAVQGGATVKIVAEGQASTTVAMGSGTVTAAANGSFAAITGLTAGTAYDLYVIDAAF
jgi:hypothetical protein